MNALEEALIATCKATDASGRRIILLNISMIIEEKTLPLLGSKVLNRIHELTDGLPVNFDVAPRTEYRKHAENLQLLLNVYKAWVRQ